MEKLNKAAAIEVRAAAIFYAATAIAAIAIAAIALAALTPGAADARGGVTMEQVFWAQDWRTADVLRAKEESSSSDFFPYRLTDKDKSLLINAYWRQGKWADALTLLEPALASKTFFPPAVRPYAEMLRVLGCERVGRHEEAAMLGRAMWDGAPDTLRYYLAFALGRVEKAAGRNGEAAEWFRRMAERAADKKSRIRALAALLETGAMRPDEAAALIADSPSNAAALAICASVPPGTNSAADYAVGYNAYMIKKYDVAMKRLAGAGGDPKFGEAAKYYHAFAAYRAEKYDTALALWSEIVLNYNEYPQRSVARLRTLAGKAHKRRIVELLKKVGETRTDYPALAADALAAVIALGTPEEAAEAERVLCTEYKATNQAAGSLWDKGWKAWQAGNAKQALAAWQAGYSPELPSRELAARLLYWQIKALTKLGSPEAAAKAREELVSRCPAEYYTFLVDPSGGIKSADMPEKFAARSELEDWGFVTYARLEASPEGAASADAVALCRSSRLAAWEGDYAGAARAAGAMMRKLSPEECANSSLLRLSYPRAFEQDVAAASKRTGLGKEYIWAIMRQESMYEPDITSSAGAYGLMQLMPATAKGEEQKMKMAGGSYRTPSMNIMLGANHFVGLLAAFKQNVHQSVAAYNAGGTPVRRWSKDGIPDIDVWVENIGYNETRGYVKAVLRNLNVYRALYGR